MSPKLSMPPPKALELFPLTELLVSVSVPGLKIPPPPKEAPELALLPLTVLLVSVNVLKFAMPPPPKFVAPLRIVTPLMFAVTPELIIKTPLLGRKFLFPSMMVVDAPAPMMVRSLPPMSVRLQESRYRYLALGVMAKRCGRLPLTRWPPLWQRATCKCRFRDQSRKRRCPD